MFRASFGPDFMTIAIHASPKIRYERLGNRAERPMTHSEAQERDIAELNRLEKGSPIALADFMIVNEGNARYFEPALGRNWTVGAGAAYCF